MKSFKRGLTGSSFLILVVTVLFFWASPASAVKPKKRWRSVSEPQKRLVKSKFQISTLREFVVPDTINFFESLKNLEVIEQNGLQAAFQKEVKTLIDDKADIDVEPSSSDRSSLLTLTSKKLGGSEDFKLDLADMLLRYKNEIVNIPNDNGETPLMRAIIADYPQLVGLYARSGAKVDQELTTDTLMRIEDDDGAILEITVPQGSTALSLAALYSPINTIRLLFLGAVKPSQRVIDHAIAALKGQKPDLEAEYISKLILKFAMQPTLRPYLGPLAP